MYMVVQKKIWLKRNCQEEEMLMTGKDYELHLGFQCQRDRFHYQD
jgi:hypothetical protein